MNAITFGRYNVVTNAHLNTIETILQKWNKVIIGIIEPAINEEFIIDNRWKDFYTRCDNNNMLISEYSIEERIEMWENTIKEYGLSPKVDVIKIKRPEYFPQEFNKKFDKNMYQLVFPYAYSEKNKFDAVRNDAFKSILNRSVEVIYPSLTLHTSDIRKEVHNIQDWKKYVPNGCYQVLLKKNNSYTDSLL